MAADANASQTAWGPCLLVPDKTASPTTPLIRSPIRPLSIPPALNLNLTGQVLLLAKCYKWGCARWVVSLLSRKEAGLEQPDQETDHLHAAVSTT